MWKNNYFGGCYNGKYFILSYYSVAIFYISWVRIFFKPTTFFSPRPRLPNSWHNSLLCSLITLFINLCALLYGSMWIALVVTLSRKYVKNNFSERTFSKNHWHLMSILLGYSPWGCKESDTTERLHFLSWQV